MPGEAPAGSSPKVVFIRSRKSYPSYIFFAWRQYAAYCGMASSSPTGHVAKHLSQHFSATIIPAASSCRGIMLALSSYPCLLRYKVPCVGVPMTGKVEGATCATTTFCEYQAKPRMGGPENHASHVCRSRRMVIHPNMTCRSSGTPEQHHTYPP